MVSRINVVRLKVCIFAGIIRVYSHSEYLEFYERGFVKDPNEYILSLNDGRPSEKAPIFFKYKLKCYEIWCSGISRIQL